MYDGVHIIIPLVYSLYKDYLWQRGFIVRKGEVFYRRGETTHMFIDSAYSPRLGRYVILRGSLHKFYLGDNATTFTLAQARQALIILVTLFGLQWDYRILRLEIGFNVEVDDPTDVVDAAILYANKIGRRKDEEYDYDEHCIVWVFKEKKKDKGDSEDHGCLEHLRIEADPENEGYNIELVPVDDEPALNDKKGKKNRKKNYILKIYKKSEDTVRCEYKACRMDKHFPFIKTIDDLLDEQNLISCQEILFKAINKVVFVPRKFVESLKGSKRERWSNYRELGHWADWRKEASYKVSREKARLVRDLKREGAKDWRGILMAGMKKEAALILEDNQPALFSTVSLVGEKVAGAIGACNEIEDLDEGIYPGDMTSSPRLHKFCEELSCVLPGRNQASYHDRLITVSPWEKLLCSWTRQPFVQRFDELKTTGLGTDPQGKGILHPRTLLWASLHIPAPKPTARGPPTLVVLPPPSSINVLVLEYAPGHSRRGGEARRRDEYHNNASYSSNLHGNY